MFFRKIIFFYYLAITGIAIISPSKISLLEYLPGIFLMWFFFLMFYIAARKKSLGDHEVKFIPTNIILLVITALIYPIFYNQYVKFYTDQSLLMAISNLSGGVSNYYIYQNFFNDSELNVFSISKLPYILGHGIFKFAFFYYALNALAYSKKRSKLEISSLILMTCVIVLVAIARGTSFEFFELFFMSLYVFALRNSLRKTVAPLTAKTILKISVGAVAFIVYFMNNIKTRMGENFDFLEIVDFNKKSVLYSISPAVALMVFSLNDYFLFGLQYTSTVLVNLIATPQGFISIFIPQGITIFGIDKSYRDYAMHFINLAAKWNPDMSIYLDKYGIVLTALIIFCMGLLASLFFKLRFRNVYASMLLFYILFFMISFPVGNFISNSSATIISITIATVLHLKSAIKWRKYEA